MDLYYQHGEEIAEVRVTPGAGAAAGHFEVRVDDRTYDVRLRRLIDGHLELMIDGRRAQAHVASDHTARWVKQPGGTVFSLEKTDSARTHPRTAMEGADTLTASTPAQVVRVSAAPGDAVTRGQTLLVLEAMKMEFRLSAPHDGTVKAVHCGAGDVVERGQLLIEIERLADAEPG